MIFNGEYQSVTVGAKNYLPIADTVNNFMVVLKVTMDNGNSYLFRVFTDKGGYTAYNRAGIQNPGDASADWGNWRNLSDLDGLITTTGVDFKVERTGANTLALSVNGSVIDNYTMKGITADNKIASVSVKHQGNQGVYVDVPFYLQAVNAPDAEIIIPALENGTVTADKESYKVGDTVTLTIAPNADYVQKLYINGKAVLLGWKTNTYSFTAEATNEITGSFEPAIDMAASDANRWDSANQAHGTLITYYPDNNDGWWMNFNGDYKSLAVNAKNYWAIADTLDNFMVVLKVTMDNGNSYLFRTFTDKGGYTAYNRAGIQNPCDAKQDWSGWKNMSKLDSMITTEGVQFKIDRTGPNTLTLSLNGEVVDTYTMNGITADNKVASISVKHQGNKGTYVTMPYVLEVAPEHIHAPAEAVKENIVDATCIAAGSYDEVVYCGECNEELSRTNVTISALGHTYVDDACITCGAADPNVPTGPVQVDELNFQKIAFNLSGYIGLQFAISNSAAANYDEVYVKVEMDLYNADGVAERKVYELREGQTAGSYLVFIHGVAPKLMGRVMHIQTIAVKDGVEYCGAAQDYSIKQGIIDRLNTDKGKTDAKSVNRSILMVDMLFYGAEAQKRFDQVKYDGLMTEDPNVAEFLSLRTAEPQAVTATNTTAQNKTNELYGYALGLSDAVELQVTFTLEEGMHEAYTIQIKCAGEVYTYDSTDFQYVYSNKNRATIICGDLAAKQMRDEATIVLLKNGEQISQTYIASIEGCAQPTVANATHKNNALVKAMMAYGDSAKVYFG